MSESYVNLPSYEQATKSPRIQHMQRDIRNGIPPAVRRRLEDQSRPLPAGWVRTFDPNNRCQFFVDTCATPPRPIWHHPYDDEQYLRSVTAEQRTHLQSPIRQTTKKDISVTAESTDDDEDKHHHHQGSACVPGPKILGRMLKDKLTGTTYEQRKSERQHREQQEMDLYRQHQIFRRGLEASMSSGQPQLLGQDENGRDLYLEPPGSQYPGAVRIERLNPHMLEVHYESRGPNAKKTRHLRPDGIYEGLGRLRRPGNNYRRPNGSNYGGGWGYTPMAEPFIGGFMFGGLFS